MIRDHNGDPSTPRRFAQDIVMAALATASARVYDAAYEDAQINALTERERNEVLRFIQKEADRCARLLGYERCVQA